MNAHLYATHIDRLIETYSAALVADELDLLVIHSGLAAPHNSFDDQDWPLKLTPAFAHWAPLAEADCALLIRPGARPVIIRSIADSYWESHSKPEASFLWQAFDVTEVHSAEALAAQIPAGGRRAFIGDALQRAREWSFAEDATNPPPLLQKLDRVRRVKSEYEVRCIAEANRRAAHGHHVVQQAFCDALPSELDLHLLYLGATRQDDTQTPYKNIVAIDNNAAVLHHINYQRKLPDAGAHALLVDAGATCFGYASDITRTICIGSGSEVELFGGLLERLEQLQEEMCRRLVAGVTYESLHDQSHRLLAAVLRDVGLARGSDDELVSSGVTRAFLPHGLGHSLGIQVHDVGCREHAPRPDNAHLRTTVDVEPDMVFTIEPGCYFIDGLLGPLRASKAGASVEWDTVDRLSQFGGIRIEDNVRVTADGNENLTRDNWPESQ